MCLIGTTAYRNVLVYGIVCLVSIWRLVPVGILEGNGRIRRSGALGFEKGRQGLGDVDLDRLKRPKAPRATLAKAVAFPILSHSK